MEPTETINIAKWSHGSWQAEKDLVVREVVAVVYLNGHELVRLHCSPDHLGELAVGHLVASGIIKQQADIKSLDVMPADKIIHVEVPEARVRSVVTTDCVDTVTTACGQGPSFYHCWQSGLPPVTSTIKFSPDEILSLVRDLHFRSDLFKQTGGVHSAALGEAQGLTVFRQDIGRHNAVDKVIGNSFLNGLDTSGKALIISGRISSDIIFKAGSLRLPVVVSPSAPTALAVKQARDLGVTVVGFARGQRLSVYSEVWRLQKP